MYGDQKIPFGIHETGKLIDVSAAGRGRKCCCTCPSCGVALQARKGDINIHHFAHDTKTNESKAKEPCDYSYEVSIRLMLKQLASTITSFTTPECKFWVKKPIIKQIEIAKEKRINVSGKNTDALLNGVSTDMAFQIGKYQLVVFVTYEGRSLPDCSDSPFDKSLGMLEIPVKQIPIVMTAENRGRYEIALKQWLENGVAGKKWITHPRLCYVEEELNQTLYETRPVSPKAYQKEIGKKKPETRSYGGWISCDRCKPQWMRHFLQDGPIPECPLCRNPDK